jgi:hypothetical protein
MMPRPLGGKGWPAAGAFTSQSRMREGTTSDRVTMRWTVLTVRGRIQREFHKEAPWYKTKFDGVCWG